jgi:hypothetical protein
MNDESAVGLDYRDLYWLENYLFSKVSARFGQTRTLSTFDFFCIVIWKAKRAKSKVSRRLLDVGFVLPSAVAELTRDVGKFPEPKERLRVLIQKWRFRLPMASAILTVLYPEEFTVYDARVCETMGDFASLSPSRVNFESLWEGYTRFVDRVQTVGLAGLSLRDKDRWLWGKSVAEQLTRDIETRFAKARVDVKDDA